ncbi:type II secretion system ATPase GspE [Pantoea sp.]|uniref:type II secretion system ATPase GspE n=1 Tax=Pantoea sp. TaxID=69393 RepID=UPI0028A17723|nr:type II secretion system ATPase GspE [Pantoea sp.]
MEKKYAESALSFFQQQGVLIGEDEIVARQDASPMALLEAQRQYRGAIQPRFVTDEKFEERLTELKQRHASASRQIADDMDASIDLMALTEEISDNEDVLNTAENSPVIRLINAILAEAVKEKASDIHIETFEKTLVIRFRIDGVLIPVLQPARKLSAMLISRIKVMARLDIAEKRLPQDGRISLRLGSRAIDVRVSTIPARHGERIVMRLLDKTNLAFGLAELGMQDDDLARLKQQIRQPHGIILVTGPTGSGKSTTLYAMLSALNSNERNILTVEDPIEYELEGIGQTQVNSAVDMTFARGLRAILRQDPDVVMIGEIRDGETARIAVQASLTGHLVLSTLHTNSACGAVSRLQDMGVEPYLIASSLTGVLAQRLVRRLCPDCRIARPVSAVEKALFSAAGPLPSRLWHPQGCDRCRQSGYLGRIAIHEVMTIDRALRQAIGEMQGESGMESLLRQQARSLRQNGLLRAMQGDTSLEEVLRVTAEQTHSGEPG